MVRDEPATVADEVADEVTDEITEQVARLRVATPPPPGGLVDTKGGVQALSAWLLSHPDTPIAFDAEGVNLCRDGQLCLVQLSDGSATWLVDVVALGKDAFEDGGLKEVLESETLLKVGYDGRADADALYWQHGVRLRNMYDIQIASCKRQDAEQGRRDRFVHGLGKAISVFLRDDPVRASKLSKTKQAGLHAFAPEHGGSYDVWVDRPLPPSLVEYAAADVDLLLAMKTAWQRFSPVGPNVVTASTRIEKAVRGRTAAKGRHMAQKDF